MNLSDQDEGLINEEMQRLAPGYRMFHQDQMTDPIQNALETLRGDPTLPNERGEIVLSRLMRRVMTDPEREGYGVPFIWWWISFETQLLRGIKQDPWSEVKWWLWNEMRGKGEVLTMWGCQNCLGPETRVRMFDGSIKAAGKVRIGEELQGDDDKPRTVISTCQGFCEMLRVHQELGMTYDCTINHKFALFDSNSGRLYDEDYPTLSGTIHRSHARHYKFDRKENLPFGQSKFRIELIGPGEYAGFEVDGNHHFLLSDGTVTCNSSKTSWMGRFAVCQMSAWLEDAIVYASGPFKEHTEDKAWASVKEWIEHLRKTRSAFTNSLGLQFSVGQKECEVSDMVANRRSLARFVALENASSVQGKKAFTHETTGMKGITLMLVDEFIENPALKLTQAESNISSNFNFFGLLACNPLPEKVQHNAIRRFSDPVDVTNLQRSEHFRWRTAYGICARFAWANSPNNILGRTQWPYLLNRERMERQRRKGSDVVDSQVDAWGFGSGARGSPLDAASVKWAGTYKEPLWTSEQTRLLVIDGAFGGEDPATATILDVGDVEVRDKENKPFGKRVISGVEQVVLPIDSDFIADQDWIDEMRELFAYSGGGFPSGERIEPVKPGTKVGGNWHLAYKVLQTAQDYNVPPQNITFDTSQRGDSTTALQDAIGRRNIRWFYEGSRRIKDEEELGQGWFLWPYEYERKDADAELTPRMWSSYCSQTISMIWFFACNMIKAGYLMNGDKLQRGIDELIARPIVRGRQGQGEGRKDVLGKEALKKMGIKSPTYGETLAIGIYFATRFLGLIKLEGPKLAVTTQQTVKVDDIIRSGRGVRFNSKQWFHN